MTLVVVIVLALGGLVFVLVSNNSDDNNSAVPGGGTGTGGDVTGSARALGEKAADIIQNHRIAEAEKLVCKAESKFVRSIRSTENTDMTVTLNDVIESGSTAEVKITVTLKADNKPRDQKISLSQKNGKWCIT